MPEDHMCSKCGAELAVREETTEYVFEKCVNGHHHLGVDPDIVDRWGGINAEVAAKKPWPEGRWVRLMPLAEAVDD